VLPDGDGVQLCRELRKWSDMPILLLSALGDEDHKVRALEAGADDYVTKPFSARELVARLQAIMRRAASQAGEAVVEADGLEVDLAARAVRRGGEEIHLTPIEFELLRALVRNRGRLLTHRALLQEVWGPAYSEDVPTLRTSIARLRRKIEPEGEPGPRYIRTDPGVGYRFVA
jgi:two-component system KDP operon response regulator KdpE